MWIFGYGSIIWRPAFGFEERREGRIEGWVRRFWQGSPDHRGVPQAPGRVVTLVPEVGGHCWGVAYRLDGAESRRIVASLDVREQGGYERHTVSVHTRAGGPIEALVYIAGRHNDNWLGPAPEIDMVRQIAAAHGPSGANAEYLVKLASSLRRMGVEDSHVSDLERALQGIAGRR